MPAQPGRALAVGAAHDVGALMLSLIFDIPRIFGRYFRTFYKLVGRHIFLLTALSVVMSYAEGIGIALFLPLLHSDGQEDALSRSVASVFHLLRIPLTPVGALPFIVTAFLLKGVLSMVTLSYQGRLSSQIPLTLRGRIIRGLQRLDYRSVVSSNAGFYSNLLVSEVGKFSSGFVFFVRTFPPALNALVFFGMVMWLDWRLTLICAAMGLVAIALTRLTGRFAVTASQLTVKENSYLTSLLIQMVQAFKYLRATAGFGTFEKRIEGASERLARAEYHNAAAAALSQSIAQPLMVIFLAGILYYRAAVQHEPLGAVFVLLLYFVRIMNELWVLQYGWQCFLGYVGPIDLVEASFREFEEKVEANGKTPYVKLEHDIRLEKLDFHYLSDRPVLRAIDLTIPRNSTVAFVGESGSGKSTLVDLIMGTLKPVAGSIVFDGKPIGELDLETLRPHIGYVPQDAMLFDDTVANNISLWRPADAADIRDAARRAKCLEFIDAMPQRLESPVGDRGVRLSGGQRQRLAIARELFKRPDILVLDEATSALDSESERAIQLSIDELRGQMTILIIAHRLSTIRNCDVICVLHEGRIVERGSYDELVSRNGSRFQRMIELQKLTQDTQAAG
jgi:subfamily B ATP-binding cassette protein MsbA